MDNRTNLIKIYLLICNNWENNLKYISQRFSNNSNPDFTDQEILTIMIYCTAFEKKTQIKEIHRFTNVYLRDWFPLLPSFVAFDKRVNRLSDTFEALFSLLIDLNTPNGLDEEICLVDSMPIITCSGKRKAKVARELTDKGFCSTKSMYFFGVKIHLLASRVVGKIPYPKSIIISPASENDLNIFRGNWSNIPNVAVFADKIYKDTEMQNNMINIDSELLTPVKYYRGVCEKIKQFSAAADKLYSRAVSQIRQPIEALFSWLIENTDIQRASKVRSAKGLMVHIYNKLAAAIIKKYEFNC